LGTDGQADGAILAINTDEARFNGFTFGQHTTGILYPVPGNVRGTDVTADVIAQIDLGAARIHRADGAGHHTALGIGGDEFGQQTLCQLLDAQRNTLALGINGQDHGFDFRTLLVLTHDFIARFVPGQVGQVHQTVDIARQADEDTEIGNRLDLAGDMVIALVVLGKVIPGIGLALLHAQRNAAPLFVDFQYHDFDFVADTDHARRIGVLVGPIHFRNMHQAFHSFLDFDEGAIIGNIRDVAEQTGVFRV